jgi:hypothetical protein
MRPQSRSGVARKIIGPQGDQREEAKYWGSALYGAIGPLTLAVGDKDQGQKVIFLPIR